MICSLTLIDSGPRETNKSRIGGSSHSATGEECVSENVRFSSRTACAAKEYLVKYESLFGSGSQCASMESQVCHKKRLYSEQETLILFFDAFCYKYCFVPPF